MHCLDFYSGSSQRSPGTKFTRLPSLEDILAEDGNSTVPYLYNESWEQAKDEIVCIIHTSGTAGRMQMFHAVRTTSLVEKINL